MSPSERDVAEVLAALQRLHHHGIVPLEEAREAARLVTKDDAFEFPPPEHDAPAREPPATPDPSVPTPP